MKQTNLQAGYSFLELMIILTLLALLGSFVVPNLFRTRQGADRKEFLVSLQILLQDAVLRSITHNKIHQIYIDIEHGLIQTRQFDSRSIQTDQHKKFSLVQDQEYLTEIPSSKQKHLNLKQFVFHNFFINGVEEMSASSVMKDVVFYIMPDGTSQAIIANLVDQDTDGLQPDVQFSFVINPFYARMSEYATFQTP